MEWQTLVTENGTGNRPMKIKRVQNRPIESKRVRNRPIKSRAAEPKRKKCQETSENPKERTVQRERERESARTACVCLRCCRFKKERERKRDQKYYCISTSAAVFVGWFFCIFGVREKDRYYCVACLFCFARFKEQQCQQGRRRGCW